LISQEFGPKVDYLIIDLVLISIKINVNIKTCAQQQKDVIYDNSVYILIHLSKNLILN
jgi:hypothetical protein